MKISEIITESSDQILTEAPMVLKDLPGAPVNFKLLNPDKKGSKYLYFN